MEPFARAIESPQNPLPSGFKLKYFILTSIFLVSAALIVGLVAFLLSENTQPAKVVAKVGEENIYQKDLNYERSQLPPEANVDQKQIIDKMVTDSIILQSGQKMNLVSLDEIIFNNPNKDYLKRMEAVNSVNREVKAQVTGIKGTAILLFFQNGFVGPLGYERSKEITLGKISRIQRDLKDKKITTHEAIGQIINDTSLKQIDEAYQSNAAFAFDVEKGQNPTQVEALNNLLWQLPENSVTDVFTDKGRSIADQNAQPDDTETYYIFAILEKKVINENLTSYNNWLNEQKSNYEVTYY